MLRILNGNSDAGADLVGGGRMLPSLFVLYNKFSLKKKTLLRFGGWGGLRSAAISWAPLSKFSESA